MKTDNTENGDGAELSDDSSASSGQTAMAFDHNDRQVSVRRVVRHRSEQLTPSPTDALLRVLCNAFAYHRVDSATKMLSALCLDKRIPHSVVTRALLILLCVKRSDNMASMASELLTTVHNYDINKREILLELTQILIRNDEIEAAKMLVEQNKNLYQHKWFRKNQTIDVYLKACISFVDYLQWKQTIDSQTNSDLFLEEKIKLSLRNLIENKNIILDNYVSILIEMYEQSRQLEDALDALKAYIDNNPNHLNAYIYLYNFCDKYPDHCDSDLSKMALQKIVDMSPENALVLDMIRNNWTSNEEKFKILMEFIDHKQNRNDIDGWHLIRELLESLEDCDSDVIVIKDLWKQFYQGYWLRLHCNTKTLDDSDHDFVEVVKCKQKVVQFFYGSTHKYIADTNKLMANYSLF